jgi:hypothetical protein
VKQQCESKQFIAINDNMKMFSRFFLYQTEDEGQRARQQREREDVRGRALQGEKDGVSNKIDHYRKHVL